MSGGLWQTEDAVKCPRVHGRIDQKEDQQYDFQHEGFQQADAENPRDGRHQHDNETAFKQHGVRYPHVPGPMGYTDAAFKRFKTPVENEVPGQCNRRRNESNNKRGPRVIAQECQDDGCKTNGQDLKYHGVGNAPTKRRRKNASADQGITPTGADRDRWDINGGILVCSHSDRLSNVFQDGRTTHPRRNLGIVASRNVVLERVNEPLWLFGMQPVSGIADLDFPGHREQLTHDI